MLITVIHIFDKLLETLYNLLNIELLNCSVIIKRVYSSLSYYNMHINQITLSTKLIYSIIIITYLNHML